MWPIVILGRCQSCFEASSRLPGVRYRVRGKESTGSTTTHPRTTHDRERLCAGSGRGRKNDVRHDGYPTPPSPEQCKPASRLMVGSSHRRITVESILGRCRVGGVSEVRGDELPAPQARWRQLVPTPVTQDGGPLRTTPAWWPPAPDDTDLAAVAASGTPVLGDTYVVDGVDMVEATFLWRDDQQHGASPSVLIHLNTLTDNHRTHIAPALAARVPGTSWWALHVLLPQDALLGYRTVVTRDPLPDDAGARRECWRARSRPGAGGSLQPRPSARRLRPRLLDVAGPQGRAAPGLDDGSGDPGRPDIDT